MARNYFLFSQVGFLLSQKRRSQLLEEGFNRHVRDRHVIIYFFLRVVNYSDMAIQDIILPGHSQILIFPCSHTQFCLNLTRPGAFDA
jgi:hypothetical protein